ncbi:TonB-dependent siderophore receptor [Variovorax boronicumulans]|uniref:TonB-dependent siderophore receptor n=1 Tax=Variovorax boronicumulans TaxID=436515 RepID=UPI0036F29325
MPLSKKPCRTALAHVAACMVLALQMQAAVAQSANFDIPAQPLAVALDQFARQARLQLVFSPGLAQGRHAPHVTGRLDVRQALDVLLRGSGLQGRIDGGTLTVQPAAASQSSELSEVRVEASRGGDARTEGSGSYTTPSTAASTGLSLSLRDTPQSVSVITRQRIDDQELQTVKEILRSTPGITVNQFDTERSTFSARGFDVDNFQYDGVPTAYKVQYSGGESEMDSVIYDRVEVVRGATGLLTGAGYPSASINLVRKHADSKVFTGMVSLGAGSWNDYRGTVDLSTPLNKDGSVRGRIVAAHQDRESFTNYYRNKRDIFYGVIDADLGRDTRFSVGVSYQKNDPRGSNWGGFPLWFADGTRTDWDRSVTTAPRWAAWATEQTNVNATLSHAFGNGWKAHLQAMHSSHAESTPLVFASGWPDRITGLGLTAYPNRYTGERQQDSVDFKVSGPFTVAGRVHEVIVGGNYTRQDATFHAESALNAQPLGNFFAWDGSYPEPAWGEYTLSEQYRTTQYGVYGAARMSLNDRTKFILGGRWSRWDKDRVGYDGGSRYTFAQTRFVPYAGLVFDLSNNYSLYASYTDIFRPQEYQDRSGNWLSPLTGQSLEAGIKGEFLEGQLNAAVSIFEIRQDNLAQADTGHFVQGTKTQAYRMAKGTVSRGVEAEVSGQLTSDWNLSASISHFKARDNQDQDVNTLSARSTARLFTTWRLPGAWSRLTVGGGINWQSKTYYDGGYETGDLRATQGAFSVVSLMAAYKFSPQLRAQLNIDNLFDKRYININTYSQGTYGTPRSARVTMVYKF